jgi:hypothetical protein
LIRIRRFEVGGGDRAELVERLAVAVVAELVDLVVACAWALSLRPSLLQARSSRLARDIVQRVGGDSRRRRWRPARPRRAARHAHGAASPHHRSPGALDGAHVRP